MCGRCSAVTPAPSPPFAASSSTWNAWAVTSKMHQSCTASQVRARPPPPPHLQAPFSGPVCGGVDADIGPGADVTETMENRKFLALRENLIGFSILCPMRLAWVAGGSSRSHPLPPPGLKLFEHSSCLYAALVFQANSLLLALYQQGCCRLA